MNEIVLEDIQWIVKNMDIEKCEGKTFLITGANGFIARYMVETLLYLNNANLLKDKCQVIALCRNKIKAQQVFHEHKFDSNLILQLQDVNAELITKYRADYIIHAASNSATNTFADNPLGIIDANVLGTCHLMNYARQCPVKGFLFFSSGAVYGKVPEYVKMITEEDYYSINPLDVHNCYAESKKMGEHICYANFRQYQTPIRIIRLGHTFGPGIDLQDGHVYSDFVQSALLGKDLLIEGDGLAYRPFCYIADAVTACFLVLLHGESGEAYNVVNNKNQVSIRELAEIICQYACKDKGLTYHYLNNNTPQKDPGARMIVDNRKIFKLGWKPEMNIVEGFKRTVASFENDF